MAAARRINEIRGVQSADEFLQAIDSMDTIKKVPIFYGYDKVEAMHRVGLVNNRTSELVGVASDAWEPVTHKEAFTQVIERARDLVGDETFYGRVQNNGNSASMEVLFGTTDAVDKLAYGLRVSNYYRVGSVLKISSMFVRAACTNGMLWSQVSANMALNHLNKIWSTDITNGVNYVVGNLSKTGDLIGTHISDAMDDKVRYPEYVDTIKRILATAGISEERGYTRLMRSEWKHEGETISRYDLYNMATAYATHLTPSVSKFDEVQRGAVRILQTPFEDLINAAAIPVQVQVVA